MFSRLTLCQLRTSYQIDFYTLCGSTPLYHSHLNICKGCQSVMCLFLPFVYLFIEHIQLCPLPYRHMQFATSKALTSYSLLWVLYQ